MNLKENYLTKNKCYTNAAKITPKGIMLHSVGTPQPKAGVFMNSWNNSNVEKCVHAFVEPGGDVYQTLPWSYKAWHCGSTGNSSHIGVEMTEPATITYTSGANFTDKDSAATRTHVQNTYNTAVELFAYLCKKYNLNPTADGVIVSHSEGYKRGIAGNHADVEHIWNKYGLTMSRFRQDIKSSMSGETSGAAVTDTGAEAAAAASTGDAQVKAFQTWLNKNYAAGLAVDGIYGTKTQKAAVRAYQKILGVTQDGVFGSKSKAAVKTLKSGGDGDAVYILQGMLYCKGYSPKGQDGKYGANTTSAVKAFQSAKGLKTDGLAGKNTMAALYS